MTHKLPCLIVDLDGTIADVRHRNNFVRTKPRNFDAFNAACVDDSPHLFVIETMRAFRSHGTFIAICSGRGSEVRQETIDWLAKYNVPYDALLLRPERNYEDDVELKLDMLTEVRSMGYEPIGVIDDRVKVVNMWREQGFFVLDANQTREEF